MCCSEVKAMVQTHWQVLQGVACHRGVCSEQVLVQLVGGPLHDAPVHAVLHCQHGTHTAAELALQPLKKRLPQALHPFKPNTKLSTQPLPKTVTRAVTIELLLAPTNQGVSKPPGRASCHTTPCSGVLCNRMNCGQAHIRQ